MNATTCAALIPVLFAELPPPTEREISEAYLLAHDWERVCYDFINTAWEDPLGGGAYDFENALQIQEGRDLYGGK
jgi:hypothetical protein